MFCCGWLPTQNLHNTLDINTSAEKPLRLREAFTNALSRFWRCLPFYDLIILNDPFSRCAYDGQVTMRLDCG